MAKQKQKLSMDELLEQALVPEVEQPYKVPENWIWTHLGSLADFIGGGTPSKSVPNYWNGSIPWASVKDVKGKFLVSTVDSITENGVKNSATNLCEIDDLILVTRIEPGKTIISKLITAINQDLKIVKSGLSTQLLYYFFLNFENELKKRASGSTVLGITIQNIASVAFPLAPLPEQQRIVDRIESLFAKLDQAKELVQNALDSFANRKAAILHQAFSGELTANWRNEHGVGMDSWEKIKFGNLGKLERGRSKHRPRNAPELFGGNHPFIQTGDIVAANVYVKEHHQALSELGLQQSKLFPKGTLCITIAANIGDVAILAYDCCFPDSVVGFTPKYGTDSKFIYYYMTVIKHEIEAKAPATAQKNINLKILNEILIKIPTLKEQKEIVRILDKIFETERKAYTLSNIIKKLDLLKKSILARAFRGKLGTNDPLEKNARELLEKVLQEKM
jgi:type I restriction enzyme, S subunit